MPVPTFTLTGLIDLTRDLSDMDNTTFVTDTEITAYLNLGVLQFHDLLASSHGQEFLLKTTSIALSPPINAYDLPDDFGHLKGVDFSPTAFPSQEDPSSDATYTYTASVTFTEKTDVYPLRPYLFADRHAGVQDERTGHYSQVRGSGMRYRVFTEQLAGTTMEGPITPNDYRHRIRLSPVEAGYIQVWYLPNPEPLVVSSPDDYVAVLFNGMVEYVAMFAAIRCLDKEESDSGPLRADLLAMESRIQAMGARDVGHPDSVRDVEDFY